MSWPTGRPPAGCPKIRKPEETRASSPSVRMRLHSTHWGLWFKMEGRISCSVARPQKYQPIKQHMHLQSKRKHMTHNQNPVHKWSTQTHVETKKAAAAIYGWDRPLLTFTYQGFDCGSHVRGRMSTSSQANLFWWDSPGGISYGRAKGPSHSAPGRWGEGGGKASWQTCAPKHTFTLPKSPKSRSSRSEKHFARHSRDGIGPLGCNIRSAQALRDTFLYLGISSPALIHT